MRDEIFELWRMWISPFGVKEESPERNLSEERASAKMMHFFGPQFSAPIEFLSFFRSTSRCCNGRPLLIEEVKENGVRINGFGLSNRIPVLRIAALVLEVVLINSTG